ncbi:MAG: alanine--tRNA ligase [Candidatus Pacebacteria bacterium]|nr:alanine--tRNA ligase [Candidatus Paceibacterota bacterium]
MTSSEIRSRFLEFFAKRGHAVLPSVSLVPKNDPSVLFNTAGMQPLVPYLMGQPHPSGNKLASCQKCVRTGDIDEIGDSRHLTFFEMLGNWSLGDYFKEEAIGWSYEFLTSKEEGLGLDPARLYITVFEGDEDAPRDTEAVEIWKKFIPENRIYFLPKENNWWSPGDNGPCGPDTEMFYDTTEQGLGDLSHEQFVTADENGQVVEIWNDVFMEYEKRDGKVIGKLSQKNVDTGSGLERISMIVQGKDNVYEADMFKTVMDFIYTNTRKPYDLKSARIIADHIRTATFLIADGVTPSNKDQGYILRRLIRRAVVQADILGLTHGVLVTVRGFFASQYKDQYPELEGGLGIQNDIFKNELEKFQKTLEQGLKEFEKGTDPFILATTYGFPIEVTEEIAKAQGLNIDRESFDKQMKAHQDASRSGAEQKFKGGLANTSEQTTRLHTAHHLLLKALQEVVSPDIHQKGSNITEERLRIDFNFDRKLTDEEKTLVENKVNEWISQDLKVVKKDMPRAEAETIGAEMEFGVKYPDLVSVYFIEDADGNVISKEFCGGPHVQSIGSLGEFKIQKEEASSAGVRRIKAVLI